MLKNLEIKNFKSLKQLKLNCERINIFIGKPNTGKSNILESLGFFSFPYAALKDFVRFESMTNLFYDEDLESEIKIKANERVLNVKFENERFKGKCVEKRKEIFHFEYNYEASGSCGYSSPYLSPLKFYRFTISPEFTEKRSDFLLPPTGKNLLAILMTHKKLKKLVAGILEEYGLRVVLKPLENKIELQKQVEDVIISYPYSLLSDTLQRVIFHFVAIETNKNSVIIFEEPEAHAFPYYTKILAEQIALDNKNNQYFISTHNPYFLLSVLEKAPKNDIEIFITYFEDYQTKVKPLNKQEKKEILDAEMDLFFNIDRFLEKEK
jgi:hypothetical protein